MKRAQERASQAEEMLEQQRKVRMCGLVLMIHKSNN